MSMSSHAKLLPAGASTEHSAAKLMIRR